MAKTGGRVKALREKAKQHSRRVTHGGYNRFSANMVADTAEANARWYTGDNGTHPVHDEDGKFLGFKSLWPKHQRFMGGPGQWNDTVEETTAKPLDRRDGGSRRLQVEVKAVVPNYTTNEVTRVRNKEPAKRDVACSGKRVSNGQSLITANWSYKPGAQWEIIKAR